MLCKVLPKQDLLMPEEIILAAQPGRPLLLIRGDCVLYCCILSCFNGLSASVADAI